MHNQAQHTDTRAHTHTHTTTEEAYMFVRDNKFTPTDASQRQSEKTTTTVLLGLRALKAALKRRGGVSSVFEALEYISRDLRSKSCQLDE